MFSCLTVTHFTCGKSVKMNYTDAVTYQTLCRLEFNYFQSHGLSFHPIGLLSTSACRRMTKQPIFSSAYASPDATARYACVSKVRNVSVYLYT